MNGRKIKKVKWKRLIESDKDQIDSDDDVEDFALQSDMAQSAWLSQTLANEPYEKLYSRVEDPRVGGYRLGPYQLVKSF